MKGLEIEQGSPEWFAARCGKVTASRVADIIAKTKTGYSTSRANYAAQLIAERLTGVPAESYTNAAMQWGNEKEGEARDAYAFDRGVEVQTVGLVIHPTIELAAASPDGLVGSDGLVEIKCPNTATHIEVLLGEAVPAKYITQIQWQLACTGRAWCDFASYDPRMPGEMQLWIRRIDRDDVMIRELHTAIEVFLSEVASTVDALTSRYGLKDAAE